MAQAKSAYTSRPRAQTSAPTIKPPPVASFPYLLRQDGNETRRTVRLATQLTSCGAGFVPAPAELAAVIHKHTPCGAEHTMVTFEDGCAGDRFVSRSGDGATLTFTVPVVDELA